MFITLSGGKISILNNSKFNEHLFPPRILFEYVQYARSYLYMSQTVTVKMLSRVLR